MDRVPGDTTFREVYEDAAALFLHHRDEAARITQVIERHSDDVLDVLENGMIRVRPESAKEIASELVSVAGARVWFSSRNGTIYISRSTREGLDAAARLRMAVELGADDEIRQLGDEIARASRRGSGNRVVLGAWRQSGGYIGEAVEEGGIFFDTGAEVWEMLQKRGCDPWLVNEAFLRQHLESGADIIDFIDGDIVSIISDPEIANTFRAREVRWLLENAGKYGYVLVGSRWVFKP